MFELYRVPVGNVEVDPPHEVLMRAHYTYMIDTQFDQKIRKLKEEHEGYITSLLENVNGCQDLEKYDVHPLKT